MCKKYSSNKCTLSDRINEIIEKYEKNLSKCTSIYPTTNLPSSTLRYSHHTPRPVSACMTDIRSQKSNLISSLSLIDTTYRSSVLNKCQNSLPKTIICPGPNLKNYLSTKYNKCPSSSRQESFSLLYEACKPKPCLKNNNKKNQSLMYCQCKKTNRSIDYSDKCGIKSKPKIDLCTPICSWNSTTYEPPFSSTILEREFTSRFVKTPAFFGC